jgi:hypothetical protein
VPSTIFGPDFLLALKTFVNMHHSIYPTVPPQGIYFEALVEDTFREIKKPFEPIEPGGRNQPRHDLQVEGVRISLKTETGEATRADSITITKLCTTEREPWKADDLVERVVAHLARYDVILMFRAIWGTTLLRYQLVDIPIALLRLIADCAPQPVGRRKGRGSPGADISRNGEKVFHVHFDASDGKCSVRGLRLRDCDLLLEWEKVREHRVIHSDPTS